MARISKAEHARILHLADVERRRIADIAADYGCSVANIYALLGKLRRAAPPPMQEAVAGPVVVAAPPPPPVQEVVAGPVAVAAPPPPSSPPAASVVDLFAVPAKPPVDVEPRAAPPAVARPTPATPAAATPAPATPAPAALIPAAPTPAALAPAKPAPAKPTPARTASPPPPPPAPRARPPAPAKPGYGLVMRSAEGEDSLAPFRSLEDLLGAIKPILRAAATSPEPVWFCIQPVDLATLDDDAV